MFKYVHILQITYAPGLKTSRLLSKPQQICLSDLLLPVPKVRERAIENSVEQRIDPSPIGLDRDTGALNFLEA